MRKSRILKAHQVLISLEELRFSIVTIANLSNPFVTDKYEAELYDRLTSVEVSIQDILKGLHLSYSQEQSVELQS
jgi:hypothetical protein